MLLVILYTPLQSIHTLSNLLVFNTSGSNQDQTKNPMID
jgi:hypothetical protein